MWIETRKSRDEITSEIELRGWRFLGYMIGSDGKEYWDDEVFVSSDKTKILWINWMNCEWFLYKEVDAEPKCTWQEDWTTFSATKSIALDTSNETKDLIVDAIGNWRYLRIHFVDDDEIKYYELADGDDIDEGIRLEV